MSTQNSDGLVPLKAKARIAATKTTAIINAAITEPNPLMFANIHVHENMWKRRRTGAAAVSTHRTAARGTSSLRGSRHPEHLSGGVSTWKKTRERARRAVWDAGPKRQEAAGR